ncbi:DUF748 domain-containing protein [Achromobacter anxifer]
MSLNATAPRRRSVWGSILAFTTLAAAVLVVLVFAATRIVELRIAGMLGPRGQVGEVRAGFTRVVLTDVAVSGVAGQADARARRVVLEPEWRAFLRKEAAFKTITVEGFDFAVVRGADGELHIAPALQAALRAGEGGEGGARRGMPVRVGDLILRGGRLEFEDAAVAKPPHRIPFSEVQARLHPVAMADSQARSDMEFSGKVEGNRNGEATVRAQGWLVVGGTDADMTVSVRNMDIRHAAPYLADNGASSLAGGAMDLDMKTAIARRELRASGTVALRGLKFSGDGSLFSLPRKAVLAAMKDHSGALRFQFTLAGDLDNPKFSVTRGFAAQVAQGFGHAIGVGAEGAAEGVTGAVKELGNALSDLLGSKP